MFGDLIVKFNVVFPEKGLGTKSAQLLKEATCLLISKKQKEESKKRKKQSKKKKGGKKTLKVVDESKEGEMNDEEMEVFFMKDGKDNEP